ncbi:MAG: hypothetical protein ACK57V_02235 [Pirellula sp.]|jgi:hypothetical protein
MGFCRAMDLPVLLLNVIEVVLALETRLWVLFGQQYMNYRLFQPVWSWIACQRMTHRPAVIVVERQVSLVSGESMPAM